MIYFSKSFHVKCTYYCEKIYYLSNVYQLLNLIKLSILLVMLPYRMLKKELGLSDKSRLSSEDF